MFNFLKNRFIAIAASSIGGEEKVVVQQQKQRHFFSSTSGVNVTECVSSCSYQHQNSLNNNMTATTTTIDQNLMDESYFLNKFDEYEKNDSWDKVFLKVNSESDSQAKKLSLCCNLSNNFHEKNRYRNVLPYDHNRIKLKSASSEHEAYINASPLELPFARRNYILTQGPLPNTTGDFWQMIYEQNVSICIMLSKVMEKSFVKCHSYFPHKDSPNSKWEHFDCQLEHEEIKPNYIIRRIRLTPLDSFFKENNKQQQLSNNFITPNNSPIKPADNDQSNDDTSTNVQHKSIVQDKSRTIHHFQFTTWPDFGVPEDTDQFLEFLEDVRRTREMIMSTQQGNNCLEAGGSSNQLNPPVVCHCSAGIGRTGTFVIVDSVLSMIEMNRINKQNQQTLENDAVNNKDDGTKQLIHLNSLEALLVFIRKHRMGLIQTSQQLRFCWKTIVDWILEQQFPQPTSPKSHSSSAASSPFVHSSEAGLQDNDLINFSSDNESNDNGSNHGIIDSFDINNFVTTTKTALDGTNNNRRSLQVTSTHQKRETLSPGGALNNQSSTLSSRGGSLSPSKCA